MKRQLILLCRPGWCLFLLFPLFVSCEPWFAYSPYDASIEARFRNTTASNLAEIEKLDAGDRKAFKVALLSDPHYHYRKLEDAITHINSHGDYAFAIVVGDLADNGLKQEFVYFHQLMSALRIPYLTTIGNHDYLSNGERIYSQMYGPANYTVVFNNVKFVFFDNNTIESGKQPDMKWIGDELRSGKDYDHIVPISHIPPYDIQMAAYNDEYRALMVDHGISFSFHGHRHDFSVEEVFGDGVQYVTVSSPQKRAYSELIVSERGLEVRKVEF